VSARSTLLWRGAVARETVAFRFSRPAAFSFRAGQALDLSLLGADGQPDPSLRHAFSIVSAPHESDLLVATRMRDSRFKKTLGSLRPGAAVELDGPFGSLVLAAQSVRPAVLIAGGIGITPFVSMLRERAHVGSSRPVSLLYSNRRPVDAAFLDELRMRALQAPTFRFVPTMTEAEGQSGWSGHTRRIDAEFIRSAVADVLAPIYYLVGPPAMVEGVRTSLLKLGVSEDDVRTEEFFGY
jgi:ferredoxin-NADP reductase